MDEMDEFKTTPIYSEFEMCVETMSVWREGRYDLDPQDTLNEIKERFSQYPKEQMKLVFEEVESGFIWDIETDEIKHEDDEDDDEDD